MVDLVTHIIFQSISQECRALVSGSLLLFDHHSRRCHVGCCAVTEAESLSLGHFRPLSLLVTATEGKKARERDSGQWPSDGHPHLGVSAALTPDTVDTKLATSLSVSLLALQLWSTLDEMNDLIILEIGHTPNTRVEMSLRS